MAFLEPDPTGAAGVVGLNGDQGVPALAPNAPSAMKALNHKYGSSNLDDTRAAFGTDLTNQFVQWEFQRAQRGIAPTSPQSTLQLLQSAKSKQAQTPGPDLNPLDVLGNVASDVGNLVAGIPKMPVQIAHDIMHAPEAVAALGSGDINTIANAPLIRMIPGVYTASNLAQGNVSELASHPVMTALDVAPYAEAAGVGDLIKKAPIPTSDGLNVGDVIDRTKAALGRSMPGQLVHEALAPEVRDSARILAEQSNTVGARALPQLGEVFNSGLDKIRQDNTVTQAFIDAEVPRARQAVLKGAIEDPVSVGATDVQSALDVTGATDAERAAVYRFQQSSTNLAQYGIDAGALTQRNWMGGPEPEVFNTADAAKLDTLHGKVARIQTLSDTRDAILNPDQADHQALRESVTKSMANDALSMKAKRNIATGYVHALDAAGYDTGSALSEVQAANKTTIGQAVGNISTVDIRAGGVKTRPARGTPSLDSRTRWLEANKDMTPTALAKIQSSAEARELKVLPARWQPSFQRIKSDTASSYLEQHLAPDDPTLPGLLDAVHNNLYSDLGKDEIASINKEALQAVQQLRDQGVNPQFVHHVSPDQERALASPAVTTLVPKASQYGSRINDWTPASDSLSVSLNHQGMELARQQGARYALDQIRDAHTVSVRDASSDLRATAERLAERRGTNVGVELEKLMRKEYVRWSDTENGFMAGNARRPNFSDSNFRPDDLLISKPLARALNMVASPPAYSRIFDPVLKVFRTAVLPFSPRFHLNNIVGGMVMSALEDPRILTELPKAMSAARDMEHLNRAMSRGQVDFELKPATQDLLERMPEQMRAQFGGLKYSVAPEDSFRLKAGGKLGELAQHAGVDRLLKAGKAAEDWSYGFNELNDNMYRIASYLSGEKNALTKNLSSEEAAARGMALANKVQPRWLEMTPMERSVFRVVFPFYGFMSHIFRFATRFPIDHPWRTAVMGSLARAEINDFGTGLPQALASAFFLGKPDPSGNVTALTPGAANPFRDLGDDLTLGGFMAQTNPIFKAGLKELGYDPTTKGPNLYPEVQYDPKTGSFKSVHQDSPGMLGELAGDVFPQVNILRALTGTSRDFRGLLQSNPDAASRMLASAAGVPVLWRQYNLNDQAFQAESNRQTDAQKVLSTAMKTGDYSRAMRYPSLRPYVAQLQHLQSQGKLAAYQPSSYSEPTLAANNAAQQGSQANTQAEVAAG